MKNNNIVFAPNIHAGGGAVLLNDLIKSAKSYEIRYYLDCRFKKIICIDADDKNITWVRTGIWGRLLSEVDLWMSSSKGARVLCLNGIPPLISSNAGIFLFIQNRIIIDKVDLSKFKLKTRIRISIEKLLFSFLKKKVNTFFVQTASMRNLLVKRVNQKRQHIKISPFGYLKVDHSRNIKNDWDFVYIADGEAHKNHCNLFLAWKILSEEGIYPKLAITLSDRDSRIKTLLDDLIKEHKLKIVDLGFVPHKDISSLYKSSHALIYPSLLESFGLPLVEASILDVPIVASELDYVRDVCAPVQTFDPKSPLSIARAVKRFMQYKEPDFCFDSPAAFLHQVFEVRHDV